jgi:heat shock protein HslJ
MGSTMMACAEGMETEKAFLSALAQFEARAMK